MFAPRSSIVSFVLLVVIVGYGCVSSRHSPSLTRTHVEVEAGLGQELRHTVTVLSGDIGERNCYRPAGLKRAADWIERQLVDDGYVTRRETFRINGKRFGCVDQDVSNLVAESFGTDLSGQVIVVGAHYDSRAAFAAWHDHANVIPDQRGTPGANDNASGVAAVLALAKRMSRQPHRRTVRFCLWVNEEPPFYQTTDVDAMGSFVSAARSRARSEDIRAVLAFDAVGCYSPQPTRQKRTAALDAVATAAGLPPTSDYVAFLATHPNAALVSRAAGRFAQHSRVPVRSVVLPYIGSMVAWSDDWSYGRQKYPAFCITDTAFLRSDRYHETSDTAEFLDYGPFADVVWGVKYLIDDLADE